MDESRRLIPLDSGDISALQRDILRVLLYFDIFNHPLTAQEIYTFLPSGSTSLGEIAKACLSEPLNSVVSNSSDHFYLARRRPSCVTRRREKEELAKRRLKIAKTAARVAHYFPFVRAVFLSGELSKGVASKEGDIDYVIVTAEGRLWTCRTFLILFKKIVLLNSKKYFCLNHFVSEDHLTVDDRNMYSGLELVTLKPLTNGDLLRRYLDANPWICEYFPNWKPPTSESGCSFVPRPGIQRFLELSSENDFGDRLEGRLMKFWQDLWDRRYPHLSVEERGRLFRCLPFLSTAYGGDFLTKILNAYHARLRLFGISEMNTELREVA